jgi:hypothetical protein
LQGIQKTARPSGRTTFEAIEKDKVRVAIFGQSVRKAPRPDKISIKAIRLLWEWDEVRITTLVRAAIRLGYHLKE